MSETRPRDDRLDRAIAALRDEAPGPGSLDEAAGRVRRILNQELQMNAHPKAIAGCEGYQALIPDYLAGELAAGRKLLFEDHSRGCVACRRALASARAEARGIAPVSATPASPAAASRRAAPLRWALAAALLLAAGLAGWQLLGPAAALAQVEAADGGLYRIEPSGAIALEPGARLTEGELVRTGRSAGSVIALSDGSRVELAPRSEIQLSERAGDTTIQVARGNIIVEASEQGSGHLYVSTEDCLVAVTGTVFSVKHGTRGSRVSVIEGQVRFQQGEREQLLAPGDQVATDPGLDGVPLEEEIAWSRFSEAHVALLHEELSALSRELGALPRPAPRFGSRLAGELPADTAVVIALPNLSGTLAEAGALIEARVGESEVLAAWWQANMADSESEADMRQLIGHLSAVGEQVGDEILLALSADEGGEPGAPLVMGALEDPEAFRQALTRELSDLAGELGEELPLRFVDDPARVEPFAASEPAAAAEGETQTREAEREEALLVWVGADRFAMTPDPSAMQRMAAGGRLEGSDFHAAITAAYAEGVEWLFAADLPRLMDGAMREGIEQDPAGLTGMTSARYLVLRQSEREGMTDTRAELSFDGPRQGLAGWLAEPASMGALDFIAPEAHVAAAFVTRAPSAIFDEMMALMDSAEPGLREDLAEAQAEADLDLRSALAEPLGGEFAFALDGPLLPEPAWKLVVEVYDPAALQASIEDLVDRSNEAFAELPQPAVDGSSDTAASPLEELPRLELTSEDARGRAWHRITETRSGLALHYTYAEGYLIGGSSRAIVERALQYRSSGVNLRTAPAFGELLAAGEDLNVSALMYQNLAPVAEPLGDFLIDRVESSEDLSADQAAILDSAAATAEMPATLAWVSALPDRLVFSGRSDGGPLGMGLGAILGIDRLVGAPAHDVQ